jgi:hypothetical protein
VQVDAIDRGDVVIKLLSTGDERDVGVIGFARVDRPRRSVIDELRARGAAHTFGVPATLDDVAAVHLTRDDLKELAHCQPNACNFKLSASGMTALGVIVNSNSPDAPQRVDEYLRRRMVEYVEAYRQRGNAAMIVYDDLGSVQSSASSTRCCVTRRTSSGLRRLSPASS